VTAVRPDEVYAVEQRVDLLVEEAEMAAVAREDRREDDPSMFQVAHRGAAELGVDARSHVDVLCGPRGCPPESAVGAVAYGECVAAS
jgi:hypothetical protein